MVKVWWENKHRIPKGRSTQVALYDKTNTVLPGRRPLQLEGRDLVAPLESTAGTQDNRLTLFFPYRGSYVSNDLTISPRGARGANGPKSLIVSVNRLLYYYLPLMRRRPLFFYRAIYFNTNVSGGESMMSGDECNSGSHEKVTI